jgi:hypothetical protein
LWTKQAQRETEQKRGKTSAKNDPPKGGPRKQIPRVYIGGKMIQQNRIKTISKLIFAGCDIPGLRARWHLIKQ